MNLSEWMVVLGFSPLVMLKENFPVKKHMKVLCAQGLNTTEQYIRGHEGVKTLAFGCDSLPSNAEGMSFQVRMRVWL